MALTGEEALALSKKHTNKAIENIGSGIHKYSTEEQIVGKWIDEKPIYEVVITGNAAGTNIDDISTGFDCSNKNIKVVNATSSFEPIDGATYAHLKWYVINSMLCVRQVVTSNSMNYNYIIIVQYTKTTD